jgi:hypothetical protein
MSVETIMLFLMNEVAVAPINIPSNWKHQTPIRGARAAKITNSFAITRTLGSMVMKFMIAGPQRRRQKEITAAIPPAHTVVNLAASIKYGLER